MDKIDILDKKLRELERKQVSKELTLDYAVWNALR